MSVQRLGDLSLELDDLADDDLQRGHERQDDLSSAAGLGLAAAARGGGPQPSEQLRGRLAVVVVVRLVRTRPGAFRLVPSRRSGWDTAPGTRARSGCRDRNSPIGPGQNRSGSERSWLANATLEATRSSRARVSARSASVSSESGSNSRKRWLSVRASSQSTNRSNRSDLPPEARNRSRAALT